MESSSAFLTIEDEAKEDEIPLQKQLKILIVDDNMYNLYTLRSLLEISGFNNIHEASEGVEAVECVNS